MEKTLRLRHPNSPLEEVVCEIRFSPETAIEGCRYKIQNKLRNNYPNLLLPVGGQGEPVGTAPYRFERENQSAGVIIAIDRFAFYSRQYAGYNLFSEECFSVLSIFLKTFKIQKLLRLGLRHTNIIRFVKDSDVLPIDDIFVIGQKIEEVLPGGFHDLNLFFVYPTETGKISTNIRRIFDQKTGQEAFLLDLDFERVNDLSLSEIVSHISNAHQESKSVFKKLITPKYYAFIGGAA